jgi:glycogen synthase
MVKVLFVTSEFGGVARAGGLGKVAAGLPRALRRQGIDVMDDIERNSDLRTALLK